MADPSVLPWALTGTGAILAVLWRALEGSRAQQVASMSAELAHERAERARERGEARDTIAALGKRLDTTSAQLERERLQAAGVALRIRQDSSVDDAFADDMPTAVRDKVNLIASRKDSAPPEVHPQTAKDLRRYAYPDFASTPPDPSPIIPPHRQKKPP